VKRRILIGTYALSAGYYDAYYLKAQQARRLIRDDFMRAFEKVDVIMGPTAPDVAFQLGAKSDDPVSMYLSDPTWLFSWVRSQMTRSVCTCPTFTRLLRILPVCRPCLFLRGLQATCPWVCT